MPSPLPSPRRRLRSALPLLLSLAAGLCAPACVQIQGYRVTCYNDADMDDALRERLSSRALEVVSAFARGDRAAVATLSRPVPVEANPLLEPQTFADFGRWLAHDASPTVLSHWRVTSRNPTRETRLVRCGDQPTPEGAKVEGPLDRDVYVLAEVGGPETAVVRLELHGPAGPRIATVTLVEQGGDWLLERVDVTLSALAGMRGAAWAEQATRDAARGPELSVEAALAWEAATFSDGQTVSYVNATQRELGENYERWRASESAAQALEGWQIAGTTTRLRRLELARLGGDTDSSAPIPRLEPELVGPIDETRLRAYSMELADQLQRRAPNFAAHVERVAVVWPGQDAPREVVVPLGPGDTAAGAGAPTQAEGGVDAGAAGGEPTGASDSAVESVTTSGDTEAGSR